MIIEFHNTHIKNPVYLLRKYMVCKRSAIWKVSTDDFAKIIKDSSTIIEVVHKFGLTNSGNWKTIMERVQHDKLDISHMKKLRKIPQKRIPTDKVMVKDSTYSRSALIIRIIKEKLIEYKCSQCNITNTHNNKPIVLQLEHKNGISNDHRIENLEFLCANCHTQTDTHGGKSQNKSKVPDGMVSIKLVNHNKYKCKKCDNLIKKTKTMICRECYIVDKNKNKPELETLKKEVDEHGSKIIAKKYNVHISTIQKWIQNKPKNTIIKKNNTTYKNHPIWKVDINLLKKTIAESVTFAEVFKKLNLSIRYAALRARIIEENIDTTNIKISTKKLNIKTLNNNRYKIPLDKILVKDKPFKSGLLRKRLVTENKMENKCVDCGNTGTWNNKPITLQLDHVNGDHNDNRLENLQIRCPNCHSQTDTFCRGQLNPDKTKLTKTPKKIHKCIECDVEINRQNATKKCMSCQRTSTRKVERPSYDDLMKELKVSNYVQVAKKYGVTDNAVRKWVRVYEQTK